MKLILASASSRRRELLSQIGVQFEVSAVNIDETPFFDESPLDYVERMAYQKVIACISCQDSESRYEGTGCNESTGLNESSVHLEGTDSQDRADCVAVLGSDTSVVVDGEILGKPADLADAKKILLSLSGRSHQVMTSICLAVVRLGDTSPLETLCKVVTTDVRFNHIDEMKIEAYWLTGEPQDKAGSYGIQGFGAVFVEDIKGSYSAVVGLPLTEVAELLSSVGILIWQTQKHV